MYFFIDIIYVAYEAMKKEEIFSAIWNDDNQEKVLKLKYFFSHECYFSSMNQHFQIHVY